MQSVKQRALAIATLASTVITRPFLQTSGPFGKHAPFPANRHSFLPIEALRTEH
jgi:hypothetical protein